MTYYTENISRLPVVGICRLVWRAEAGWATKLIYIALVLYSRKLLRRRGLVLWGVPHAQESVEVEWSQMPDDARAALEEKATALEGLGWREIRKLSRPFLGDREGYAVCLADREGTAAVTVDWSWVLSGETEQARTICEFTTFLADGRTLFTTSEADLGLVRLLPSYVAEFLPKATIEELAARHEARVETWTGAEVRAFDGEGLAEAAREQSARAFDRLVEARFYLPLTEADVLRLGGGMTAVPREAGTGADNPYEAPAAEVTSMADRGTTLGGCFVTLLVTMVTTVIGCVGAIYVSVVAAVVLPAELLAWIEQPLLLGLFGLAMVGGMYAGLRASARGRARLAARNAEIAARRRARREAAGRTANSDGT